MKPTKIDFCCPCEDRVNYPDFVPKSCRLCCFKIPKQPDVNFRCICEVLNKPDGSTLLKVNDLCPWSIKHAAITTSTEK